MLKCVLAFVLTAALAACMVPAAAVAGTQVQAQAQSWDVSAAQNGTVTATLSSGVLTVSGNGAMADYAFSGTQGCPWASCKSEIKSVVVSDGVTVVGAYAFYGCDAMKTLKLAKSVTYVGDGAFYECSALSSIYFMQDSQDVLEISPSAFHSEFSLRTNIYVMSTGLANAAVWNYDWTEGGESYRSVSYCDYLAMPGKPTKLAFTAGTKTVTLTWKKASDATCYKVQVKKSGVWADFATVKTTKAKVTGLTPGKACQVRVVACVEYGADVYTGGSAQVAVAAKPATPSGVKVKAAGGSAVRVSWKKAGACSGYQVRYSTKASMKGAKSVTVAGGGKTSAKLAGAAKKTCYVQVRAYAKVGGTKVYSSWSS